MLRYKSLLIILLFLLILFGVIWYNKKEREVEKIPSDTYSPPSERSHGMKLEGMEYSEVADGRVKWQISADVAEFFQEEKKSLLKGVVVKFYIDDKSFIVLEGKEGLFYAGTKDIEILGGVVVKLPNGYIAETEKVRYINQTKEIRSDSLLKVSGNGFSAIVNRWRYDVEDKKAYGEDGVDIKWDLTMPVFDMKERK